MSRDSLSVDTNKTNGDAAASSTNSHRFFLRKKNSRTSLSPQTSSSSISSLLKKSNKNPSQEHLHKPGDSPTISEHPHNATGSSNASIDDTSSNSSLNNKVGGPLHLRTPENHDNNQYEESDHHDEPKKSKNHAHGPHGPHGHHLSLKRFLKKLKHSDASEKSEHASSSSSSTSKNHSSMLPLHSSSELYKKYGGLGKLIGSGASGSVNLVTSKSNPSQILAIKKFRHRLQNESESDYKIKVKNEFKIGQYLHHQNLIHTMELIKEHDSFLTETEYYIVMEYCPYDFFNLVMSGLMDGDEIACYFKQIVNGVNHLHSNGIAHRDLKLDNCVVNADGIIKLIDFGSAVQFRKERASNKPIAEDDIISDKYRLIRARGIVGSDPYLAPEVFEPSNFGYDPRGADVWSIAIIFCCMTLKRFPWKIPKSSDPSYRSFAGIEEDAVDQFSKLKIDEESHHRGTDRLLRLLPTESRPVIQRMLELDPKKRFLIDDVANSIFYQSIDHCHVLNDVEQEIEAEDGRPSGLIHKAETHTHHLVTEDDLKKIQLEKEKAKKLKQ